MSDWIHGLPTLLMAVVIFAATWLATAVIYAVVMAFATGERARDFSAITPALLPPLGIIFGILVAFLASQAWGDVERARTTVNREASALRAVVLLSNGVPAEVGERIRGQVRRQVEEARTKEWPAMAAGSLTLTMVPVALADALQATLALPAEGSGQVAAQREIVVALETALDARRQRILVSQAELNVVKWLSLMIQAACTLAAIAMMHCDNRRTARLAMGLFSTAVAVCILLILAHDRPFTGPGAVSPAPLLQVQP
jgi:MFS family permease